MSPSPREIALARLRATIPKRAVSPDPTTVWHKTDAGREEMRARARVAGRAQRNLLLLADGRKTAAELVAAVHGTTFADLKALAALGLLAADGDDAATAAADLPATHADFAAALLRRIEQEFGTRGLPLAVAVEEAATFDDLRAVALRVIEVIAERNGEAAAAATRQRRQRGGRCSAGRTTALPTRQRPEASAQRKAA